MSSTLVSLLLSLLFVIILACGFFIGMWRGLKRSVLSLVICIAGAVLAFFITPTITNALLEISVSVDGTNVAIREVALQLAKDDPDISLMLENNANLKTLFLALPEAILNAILFLVVTIAVESVLYIVYKIFAVTLFKNRIGQKKHRIWGGTIGLIKVFILTIFALMPIASLVGIASSVTVANSSQPTASASETTSTQTEGFGFEVPQGVEMVIDGMEKSLLIKTCGIFGLDDVVFDHYASVQIEGENVVIRKEFQNVVDTVDAVYQINASLEGTKEIDYADISKNIDKIIDSGLFKTVVSQTLGDLLENYQNYSFFEGIDENSDEGEILQNISHSLKIAREGGTTYHQYFANDIEKVVNVLKAVDESDLISEAQEYSQFEAVLDCITSEDNIGAFKAVISNIFEMNLFRAVSEQVVEMFVEDFMSDLDEIQIGQDFTEQDWEEISNSIINIVEYYSDIVNEIDVQTVLSDPTLLLDESKNYDIESITSNLGKLLDEIRGNKLLKNSEGKPIVDKFLSKEDENDIDLSLPVDPIDDGTPEGKTIENYQQLFAHITPSLILLRDEGIYSKLTQENISTNEMIKFIANKLIEDGKNDLLSEILLPLYQVEPTKSLIAKQAEEVFAGADINLGNTFNEWKKNVADLENVLSTLNEKVSQSKTETYLDLLLEGRIKDIPLDKVNYVFEPVLYADVMRDMALNKIEQQLSTIVNNEIELVAQQNTFVAGSSENQMMEFCGIMQGFIAILKTEQTEIKNIDKTLLGVTLEVMKCNAYRTSLTQISVVVISSNGLPSVVSMATTPKANTGIFRNAFFMLMDEFKSEYSEEISALESVDNQLYADLTEGNYDEINFVELMEKFN